MSDHMCGKSDLMAEPGLPITTPLPMFDTALAGVRQYYAITTALDLGLFELLRVPLTASECANALGCQRDLIGLLCDCLESLGLLEKTKDRYQTSTTTQAFLTRDSPFCQGHAIAFQRRLAGLWANLPAIVKDGPVTYDRASMFRDVI
ncbi:MAG: methyltransferase dimerization domain-containing protein, partial [Methanoregula sp.]